MARLDLRSIKLSKVYPMYLQKAARKRRNKEEVDQIISWLTGYSEAELRQQIEHESDLETLFGQAPHLNANRSLIKGVVCGVRVEEIEDPLEREVRYLDKLIDELSKGKAMERILRRRPRVARIAPFPLARKAELLPSARR